MELIYSSYRIVLLQYCTMLSEDPQCIYTQCIAIQLGLHMNSYELYILILISFEGNKQQHGNIHLSMSLVHIR